MKWKPQSRLNILADLYNSILVTLIYRRCILKLRPQEHWYIFTRIIKPCFSLKKKFNSLWLILINTFHKSVSVCWKFQSTATRFSWNQPSSLKLTTSSNFATKIKFLLQNTNTRIICQSTTLHKVQYQIIRTMGLSIIIQKPFNNHSIT